MALKYTSGKKQRRMEKAGTMMQLLL